MRKAHLRRLVQHWVCHQSIYGGPAGPGQDHDGFGMQGQGDDRVKTVVYPGNRWRDNNDHLSIVCRSWEKGWQAPDGATVIACCYDLVRACCLQKAVPGKPFLSADEFYKKDGAPAGKRRLRALLAAGAGGTGEYCSRASLRHGVHPGRRTLCVPAGRRAGYLEFRSGPPVWSPLGKTLW